MKYEKPKSKLAKTPVSSSKPKPKKTKVAEALVVPEKKVETILGAPGTVASSKVDNDSLRTVVAEAVKSGKGFTIVVSNESDASAAHGLIYELGGGYNSGVRVSEALSVRATWRAKVG